MRRLWLLVLLGGVAACASGAKAVSPETLADLRAKARACTTEGGLPPMDYHIDRFGQVVVSTRSGQAAANSQARALAACIRAKGSGVPAPQPVTAVPTITPAAATSPSRTAERLQELDDLKRRGLISEDEYQATRKRILEGL